MEELIKEYLTQYYYIDKSSVGNYGIYKYDDLRPIKVPTGGQNLIFEINDIYSLSVDDIFKFIYNWTLEQNPDVNMNFYWMTNTELHDKFLNDTLLIDRKTKSLHMRYIDLITKESVDS